MATEKSQVQPSAGAPPPITSCRKKKSEDASFIADLRVHIDEFINASMDEHKTCFQKTMKKMFGISKAVAERSSAAEGVESVLPLKTTVAD